MREESKKFNIPNEMRIFLDKTFYNHRMKILIPSKKAERNVGLLNHISLPEDEGLLYSNTKLFHTFNMNFSIVVICFDKHFKISSKPSLIKANSIFIVPKKSKYTLELSQESLPYLIQNNEEQNQLVDISIIYGKKAFFLYYFIKKISIILFLIFIFLISFSIYGEENIHISMGKTRTLDLGKPPLSIQISDPEILSVERLGVSNSIKISPKQEGETQITIDYPGGDETTWKINIGKFKPSLKNSVMENLYSSLEENPNSSELKYYVKKINKIQGIKSHQEGEKIILLGKIESLEDFLQLSQIVSSHPTMYFPAYDIDDKFQNSIVTTINSEFKLYGERNLRIIPRQGLYTVIGVPSSPASKVKIWNYLNGLIPNIVDAMSFQIGDSALVQINLDFLEIAKGARKDIGFKNPFLSQVQGGLNFTSQNFTQGISEPTLQIGPISSFFKAIQNNSYMKELAKPVILSRSGEKAFFLAGGEVQIVTSTASSSSTTSSVTYKPFGILFHVTPQVQVDGSIWLKLNLEVSDISEALSYQNIPGFTSRKIENTIILTEGDTAVLSGLVQNKNSSQIEKVPFLGNIPILGELFKSRNYQENQTELWVAITVRRVDLENRISPNEIAIQQKFEEAKKNISKGLLD